MSNGNIKFKCPHCGQVSEGLAQYAGTEDNCPSCGKRFQLVAMTEVLTQKQNCLMCYVGMLRRYVGFSGRTPRREFWWALLFNTIASFIVAVLDGIVFTGYNDPQGLFIWIYLLATLLPLLAIQVRRLHDTNKSGWWVLLVPIPVINLAYLVWLATDSDKGTNRFGADTKSRA